MADIIKNAPVYFTIAQVRHNLIPSFTPEQLAQLLQAMKGVNFPDYCPEKLNLLKIGPQAQPPQMETTTQHIFYNIEKTAAFILEPTAVTFYTSAYTSFPEFLKVFIPGLEQIANIAQLGVVERTGLRYLNAIDLPNGESDLARYLAPGVLGISARLNAQATIFQTLCETHIQFPHCVVLARTIISPMRLGFPIDVNPMGIGLAPRFQGITQLHAVVDIDASTQQRAAFDMKLIQEQLNILHDEGIWPAFNANIGNDAISCWNNLKGH